MISGQPWRFENIGEGTHLFLSVPDIYDEAAGGQPLSERPQVRPFLVKLRVTTVTGGNVMITTGAVDPHILLNITASANADYTLDMMSNVKGVFIEDLPADGLVEVWHG